MAKTKKKKEVKKGFEHSVELYGIFFILIAILGIGKYGPVGRIIASFALFLVGSLYMVLLIIVLFIGIYLIIKRSWPDFFTTKLIGTYVAVLGFLILMHKEFVIQNDGNMIKIFKETVNQLVASFNSIMNSGSISDLFSVGGGIIGGVFAILFDKLFSVIGMEIVAWVMVGLGLLLFTGFSLFDFLSEKYELAKENRSDMKEEKRRKREEKKKQKEIEKEEQGDVVSHKKVIISSGEEEEEDFKKVITSLDELTNNKKIESVKSEEPVQGKEFIEEEKVVAVVPTVKEVQKHYSLPSIELLDKAKKKQTKTDQSAIEENIIKLENVLKDFGISGKVVEVHVGPTVTQYELELKSGTKVSKILSINREIALELANKDVRIQAPIPGKSTVGIELANKESSSVSFREVMEKVPKNKADSKLLAPLGKNIMGNMIACEINKTPHLLVAGSTGSGKSVCINGIICSILMRAKPDEVKLVMVDPKKVELSVYNGIPHLLCPVVTDPKKASVALNKIVVEMENRYETFSETKTKNIQSYNEYVENRNKVVGDDEKLKKMPFIVVIVDELADLMMVASKDVEASIMRITQMARAAGIHLIIATQRPSTNVITGVIKANIPSRIAFAVSNGIDSRTIIDMVGAEKLLGKGDMLFLPMGEGTPERVQGAFISDDEIKRLIDYAVEQQQAEFDPAFENLEAESKGEDVSVAGGSDLSADGEDYDDPLYNEIVDFVVTSGKASASLLQRRFKLGYNRAARIIDLLEERGIIGPANGSKPRAVLVKLEENVENEE